MSNLNPINDIYKKYLKYKLKYLSLKSQLAGKGTEKFPDLIPYEGKEISWFVKQIPWDVIMSDKKNFIWTTNIEQSEIESGLFNAYVAIDGEYSIPHHVFTPGQIKTIIKANPLDTPGFTSVPYTYEPVIILPGVSTVPVNLFYNLFSNKFMEEIQDKIILNWLKRKGLEHISQHIIQEHRINSRMNLLSQPRFLIGSAYSNIKAYFKVHLTVKLDKLFWAVEQVLANLEKFKTADSIFSNIQTYSFESFKIMGYWANYTILEPYRSTYPKDPSVQIKSDRTYEFKGFQYKFETNLYLPNIVFYLPLHRGYWDYNRKIISHTIKTLMELFPDSLNISSHKNPRFNFRANDTVFFAFGDGASKEKLANGAAFKAPLDIAKCETIGPDQDKCDEFVYRISNFVDRDFCFFDTRCKPNPLMSINKLLDVNYQLVTGPDVKLDYIKDVYEYVGLGHLTSQMDMF